MKATENGIKELTLEEVELVSGGTKVKIVWYDEDGNRHVLKYKY